MNPNQKAQELVYDCLQIQLSNPDFVSQYEMAKIQAEYTAHVAKFSHDKDSEKFKYWEEVKQEILKL